MIYSSLNEFESDRVVRTIWGHDVPVGTARSDLERLEDKIDAYTRELNKQHDTAHRRRLRAKLERFEREHDFLFRALNPPSSSDEEYVGPDTVQACRSTVCSNQLTRTLAYRTMGFCPPCWNVATQTSDERA